MDRKYYTELLPTELQGLLLFFLDYDSYSIHHLCISNMIRICSNDHPIWKKLFSYYITSNKEEAQLGTNSEYLKLLANIKYLKNNWNGQVEFLRLIKANSADILLENILKQDPDIFDKVRGDLLGNLMSRYLFGDLIEKSGPIPSIEFPIEYLPILLQNNDIEAAKRLAGVSFGFSHPIVIRGKRKELNDLIKIVLPKIPIHIFKEELLRLNGNLNILQFLGIAHYFR